MNLLVVTQYFWPEQFIINDLVKYLAQKGHTIKVLTGKPNYPQGDIYPGYTSVGCTQESYLPGVDIFRIPLTPRRSGKSLQLIKNYLSFIMNGLRYFPKALDNQSFDMILAMGLSPITSILPAIWLKKRFKYPLTIWVQDLWPESIQATKRINNKTLLGSIRRLVGYIYRQADTILIQSEAFRSHVSQHTDANKCIYYPNSYDDRYLYTKAPNQLPASLIETLNTKFCIVFTGNIGEAQGWQTWVETAQLLKDLPSVSIVIVGTGSQYALLEAAIQNLQLSNLVLAGAFPQDQMQHIFAKAQGLLVSLIHNPIISNTIPSKIQAYMAAGRPIIGALDGEGASIINAAKAGFTCPSEDPEQLAVCIKNLVTLTEADRNQLGASARAYYNQHFNMELLADKLIDIFKLRLEGKHND